uniref:ATP synthase B chain n=1 Tax=Palmaria palmata TaxID=2822 RepID=A0A0A7A7C5_PALPL|nr:ATP synthase B chain precursor [Palmaria palmata]AHB62152.1 ATP synthase B chain precursor [Palmaria palmata]
MLNYLVLFVLSTTVLITHNIILLNEETLILVCFITFFWLGTKNLSAGINDNLESKIFTAKNNLERSLKSSLLNLQNLLNMQKRFWVLLQNFKQLGYNCLRFAGLITDAVVSNSAQSLSELFPQKLQFTIRLENQTANLLSKLIILKLRKIVKLKGFYSSVIGNPHFVCSDKIIVRECIQKINSVK